MEDRRQKVGKKGETEACVYLESRGHRIVARNWRSGHLEIDIITLDGKGLHFVEVKSRTVPVLVEPQANVNAGKRGRMVRASLSFLHSDRRKMLPEGLEVFFDVVTVIFDSDRVEIEYFPQAFIPTYV